MSRASLKKTHPDQYRSREIVCENGFIMSKEHEEETRLYRCAKKYEIIVKQFDELIGMINTRTRTRPPKRRRSSKGSSSGTAPLASSTQHEEDNEVFVQTITRFLHELKTNPTDLDCSLTTKDPE